MPDDLELSLPPVVLSTSPFTPSALQSAVEAELVQAPENALVATVDYNLDGTWKSTTMVRIDRDRWVLGIGGFVQHDATGRTEAGVFGKVTVTF